MLVRKHATAILTAVCSLALTLPLTFWPPVQSALANNIVPSIAISSTSERGAIAQLPDIRRSGLGDRGLWARFNTKHVEASGRVVDNGANGVSHSEGQGYAMLFAVAANDQESFARIWDWTKQNLRVRDDRLFAWRWSPHVANPVEDRNNASDGSLVIAWALVEAGSSWERADLTEEARQIVADIWRKDVFHDPALGPLVKPGERGFGSQTAGHVINPSYWVFPAIVRLSAQFPNYDWRGLIESGENILEQAHVLGGASVAGDWMRFADSQLSEPSEGAVFGYDAIRIPVFLVWASPRSPLLNDYQRVVRQRGTVSILTGALRQRFAPRQYESVEKLLNCAVSGEIYDGPVAADLDGNYYPDAMRLLTYLAFQSVKYRCASIR